MQRLGNVTFGPELLTDEAGKRIIDQSSETLVGVPGPFGRERVVTALPLRGGPVAIAPPFVVCDQDGAVLADPAGNVIGTPAIIVHRMLAARWTADTRRLG